MPRTKPSDAIRPARLSFASSSRTLRYCTCDPLDCTNMHEHARTCTSAVVQCAGPLAMARLAPTSAAFYFRRDILWCTLNKCFSMLILLSCYTCATPTAQHSSLVLAIHILVVPKSENGALRQWRLTLDAVCTQPCQAVPCALSILAQPPYQICEGHHLAGT